MSGNIVRSRAVLFAGLLMFALTLLMGWSNITPQLASAGFTPTPGPTDTPVPTNTPSPPPTATTEPPPTSAPNPPRPNPNPKPAPRPVPATGGEQSIGVPIGLWQAGLVLLLAGLALAWRRRQTRDRQ